MVSSDDITPAPAEASGAAPRRPGPDPGRIGSTGASASARRAHLPARGAHVSGRSPRVSGRGAHVASSPRGIVGRGRVGSARTRATAASGRVAPPPRPIAASPRLKHAAQRDARVGIRARRAAVGAGLAVLIVVSAIIGAVAFGGRSSPGGSPPAAVALATRAAISWVDGTAFTGPRQQGVPADLGRSGSAPDGTVEAVGSATSGGITRELLIVTPPTGTVYGLSVVIDRGRVAYPVTVTLLPFARSIPAGTTPTVPEQGTTVTPTASGPAQAWAEAVFGVPAHPAGALGYGVAGAVKVLEEWRPATGAAFVTRVLVPLAGPGPGRTVSRAEATARAAVAAATLALAAAPAEVATSAAAVVAAQKALTTVTAVEHAAEVAAAVAGTVHPRRAARETAAAATARSEVAADQKSLTAALARQAAAISKRAAVERAAAAAQTRLGEAVAAAASTVLSVYDVAYNRRGQATAWAPADDAIRGA
jgi:hypothetical protein